MGDDLRGKVLQDLSDLSHVPVPQIKDTDKLADDLNLTHNDLVFLTMSLLAAIQQHKPSATLKVSEVEKPGMTVGDLVTLVNAKVQP